MAEVLTTKCWIPSNDFDLGAVPPARIILRTRSRWAMTRAMGSRASVQTLVIEHLNLLDDPFIQNRVHLRAVGGVYPRRGVLMDV
jgi:hypothetical protein